MIEIINGDSGELSEYADLIFTDPPYDMPGSKLLEILNCHKSDHIILIATMRQLADVFRLSDLELAFDFVLDAVVPKKSKSIQQPNYTHQNGVYLKRPGVRSIFNRKLRQRSDTFDNNGYWPTVIRSPRNRNAQHGMAKNEHATKDILGCFEAKSVLDPFAGTGTVALAAFDFDMSCIAIEKNAETFETLRKNLKFMGCNVHERK